MAQQDLNTTLFEVHGKLGEISSDIKHILDAQKLDRENTRQLDKRLTTLEAFRWKLLGIAATGPVLVALALEYARKFSATFPG